MIDFKELFNNAKTKVTSPTAFSWYGVAGVVATCVLTFVATRKWDDWFYTNRSDYFEDAFDECCKTDPNYIDSIYREKLKDRPFTEKAKEVLGTALIFTPPFTAAALSCYCILHGNKKAFEMVGALTEANNMLSLRLDKYKTFAAGAIASEIRHHEDEEIPVCGKSHNLYFSEDDLQHEEYGKQTRFVIERTGQGFTSTLLEVTLAELEFNKIVWGYRCGDFGTLNELLDLYGVNKVDDGDYCCWSKEAGFNNGYSWVEFTHKRMQFDDGERGYMICFDSEPTYDEFLEKLMYG